MLLLWLAIRGFPEIPDPIRAATLLSLHVAVPIWTAVLFPDLPWRPSAAAIGAVTVFYAGVCVMLWLDKRPGEWTGLAFVVCGLATVLYPCLAS